METITRSQLARERGVSLRTIERHFEREKLDETLLPPIVQGCGGKHSIYDANAAREVFDEIERTRPAMKNSRRWKSLHHVTPSHSA